MGKAAAPLFMLLPWVAACTGSQPRSTPPPPSGPAISLPAAAVTQDPDGEDDGVESGSSAKLQALAKASRIRFERVAPPEGAHPLVCDLTPFRGRLYVSFAVEPIDADGARIYSYGHADPQPWKLAFNWDRNGVPYQTREVGGQGITRVRSIRGQLFATDSDAPRFGGFGYSTAPFEDYLFVSNPDGTFPALEPGDKPPKNTRVVPLSFHMFDVIQYGGALVATGGTVAIERRGTRFPGGLFVGELAGGPLTPRWRPGEGKPVGVVRTTYMHRFRGRLYIGFQNNERRIRWDLAVLSGPPLGADTAAPVLARVTRDGGWLTRRFASVDGRLYWIASGYRRDRRGGALFASDDGARFRRIRLPSDAGAPQDLIAVGKTRYLLTSSGLYRADASDRYVRIGAAPARAFDKRDPFCSAPITAMSDALYAGSTRDGALYRIVADSGLRRNQ